MTAGPPEDCPRCSDPAAFVLRERPHKRLTGDIAVFKCPACGALILDDMQGPKGAGLVMRATQETIDKYVKEHGGPFSAPPSFERTGTFPAPAGDYRLEVRGRLFLSRSGCGEFSPEAADAAGLSAGWALPAKGGGFAALWLRLKDGRILTLLQSEGYTPELAWQYSELGRELAAALGVGFAEEPQGPDC